MVSLFKTRPKSKMLIIFHQLKSKNSDDIMKAYQNCTRGLNGNWVLLKVRKVPDSFFNQDMKELLERTNLDVPLYFLLTKAKDKREYKNKVSFYYHSSVESLQNDLWNFWTLPELNFAFYVWVRCQLSFLKRLYLWNTEMEYVLAILSTKGAVCFEFVICHYFVLVFFFLFVILHFSPVLLYASYYYLFKWK